MTKEDLSCALGFTCVENYYLAHFSKFFDVRTLYVESFLPFNEVINNFTSGNARFEYYPITKVQDTASGLGVTEELKTNGFNCYGDRLNLVRVNREFFDGISLAPWRQDHFISIERQGEKVLYINNYPLSSGELTLSTLHKVFDGFSLAYTVCGKINKAYYKKLKTKQMERMKTVDITSVTVDKNNIYKIKNALLILKISRQRIKAWLEMLGISNLNDILKDLINMYGTLAMKIQVMQLRNKIDIDIVQSQLNEIICKEKMIKEGIKECKQWQ